jgi:menaquinone-dependent protoporphyrinogen oxidase
MLLPAERELRRRGAVNVLMAYATRNGSTRQVAEAIAVALREAGVQVTALPARTIRESAAGYDLIVVGAPLYSGRWHRDAHRFLKRHRRELAAVPVAVFGMGPRNDAEDAWRRSHAQLDQALARHEWLAPAAVTVFGGVDPPRRGKRPRRDLRDWRAIDAWATEVLTMAARDSGGHRRGVPDRQADTGVLPWPPGGRRADARPSPEEKS